LYRLKFKNIGVDSVTLRYNPILINSKFNIDMHIKYFEKLLQNIRIYTHDCTISFLDLYEKVKRNAPGIRHPIEEEQIKIAKTFSRIGKENDIIIHICCENKNLKKYGLDITGCMSQEIVEKALSNKLNFPKQNIKRDGCNRRRQNYINQTKSWINLNNQISFI